MDTTLDLSSDGTTVRHVNTLYVESVDSECSTCYDRIETQDMPVGEYTKDTFRQRASGRVYLSGPGVTRRGDMTMEVGFRDADRRVRCIISHRPQFNGPEPPSQLALERIVIVRETLFSEISAPLMKSRWAQLDRLNWLGLWRGRSMVFDCDAGDGGVDSALAWREDILPPHHLRKCRCSGAADPDSHALLEFDGGIRLEAPRVVLAGEPAELSIRWGIGRSMVGEQRRILEARVGFEALSRIVDSSGEAGDMQKVRISPPKLLRLDVEDLEPVESAGLR